MLRCDDGTCMLLLEDLICSSANMCWRSSSWGRPILLAEEPGRTIPLIVSRAKGLYVSDLEGSGLGGSALVGDKMFMLKFNIPLPLK